MSVLMILPRGVAALTRSISTLKDFGAKDNYISQYALVIQKALAVMWKTNDCPAAMDPPLLPSKN